MYDGVNDLLECLQDGRLVSRQEARSLIEALEELHDRMCAAGPAGDFGPDLDLSSLRRATQSENQQIRKIATLAMARFGDPESQRSVKELLSDPSPVVRQAAADIAGALEQAESAPALISLLNNADEQPGVRRAALLALARIRQPAAAAAIAEALADPDPEMRKLAVRALATVEVAGGPSPAEALCGALRDEMSEVRARAAEALGRIADPSAADALSQALADADAPVRDKAAIALGRLKDARALPALVALLNKTGPGRQEVAEALGGLSDPSAAEALSSALADSEAAVRLTAVHSLRRIGDLRVLSALRSRIEMERDPAVREALEAAVAELEAKLLPAQEEPTDEEPGVIELDILDAIDRAASDLGCEIEKTDAGFSLAVPVPGAHKQTVTVTVGGQREETGEIVRVTSACGPADSGNYRNALLLNQHLVFGAISVKKQVAGETFELSEAFPARDATVVALRTIISYIASSASQIAGQLAGE